MFFQLDQLSKDSELPKGHCSLSLSLYLLSKHESLGAFSFKEAAGHVWASSTKVDDEGKRQVALTQYLTHRATETKTRVVSEVPKQKLVDAGTSIFSRQNLWAPASRL